MELKFFKPLEGMTGGPCPVCQKPTDMECVLVQENYPGGGSVILHDECLKTLTEQPTKERTA